MNVKTKRVLVIDDEQEIVHAAKRMLERLGYVVDTAFNGKDGMSLVNSTTPDIIITDIIMPIMDGYEFYKKLRTERQTARIPVIILTARPNMEDSFRALGVQGFITKPFTSENLADKIQQLTEPEAERTQRGKMLVCGSEEYVINHMAILLKDDGYDTMTAENSSEVLEKALKETPNYIFIDVYMRDLPSRELIKSLRCFHKLDNTKIVIYTNFSPENPKAFSHVDYLQEAKEACMQAGADYYIGRFSSVNFIESLNAIRYS